MSQGGNVNCDVYLNLIRFKNMMGKLFQYIGCVDINDIEFKIIKFLRSVIVSVEVGVEVRYVEFDIIV